MIVNEYMQRVSNPAVYAAGDVANGGLPLTPIASFEAYAAAANLLEGNNRKVEYPPIPSVVFTLPPLASVGLGESEAKERGLEVTVNQAPTSGWYSSRRVGEEASGYKVLVDPDTERILGAHLLGPNADELVNLFAMAMRCGMTSPEIKKTMIAYPTAGSELGRERPGRRVQSDASTHPAHVHFRRSNGLCLLCRWRARTPGLSLDLIHS